MNTHKTRNALIERLDAEEAYVERCRGDFPPADMAFIKQRVWRLENALRYLTERLERKAFKSF